MSAGSSDTVEVADDAYDVDGVDRSLIRWMLRLTPTERLEAAQDLANLAASVKRAERPLR